MGISTVSTFPFFMKKYGSDASAVWNSPDDLHFNSRGHAFFAEIFLDTFGAKLKFTSWPL
jgi:hypothetical protein